MSTATPNVSDSFADHPWLRSHKRLLDLVFPGSKVGLKLVDLGCLSGSYTVEFARMGFDALGIEIREENIRKCLVNQQISQIPNLSFVKDTVLNVENYGKFDVSFCSGLLYHLDKPATFIEKLSRVTKKIIILQTHFSVAQDFLSEAYGLSSIQVNDGVPGRWFSEGEAYDEKKLWSAWENSSSFWIQKEYLVGKIKDCGFELVFEQFDGYTPGAPEHHSQTSLGVDLDKGYYPFLRSSFIGIRA